jgi:molybdopterin-guanine dinucleotide biosynthesis protein
MNLLDPGYTPSWGSDTYKFYNSPAENTVTSTKETTWIASL